MPFELADPAGAVETNGAETVPLLTIPVPEGATLRLIVAITATNGADDVFGATLDALVYRLGAADVTLVNQALDPKWGANDGSNYQAEAVVAGPDIRIDVTGVVGQVVRWTPDGHGALVR